MLPGLLSFYEGNVVVDEGVWSISSAFEHLGEHLAWLRDVRKVWCGSRFHLKSKRLLVEVSTPFLFNSTIQSSLGNIHSFSGQRRFRFLYFVTNARTMS